MTKVELMTRIAESHNKMMNIEVRGDNVIALADAMYDLRLLVKQLQAEDVVTEKDEKEESSR